jgi:hypothetical protein
VKQTVDLGLASVLARFALRSLTIVAFAAFAVVSVGPLWGAVPEIVVQAPAEFINQARFLESVAPKALETPMRVVGLSDPGPPILVFLEAESSPNVRHLPPWVAGFAQGERGVVVLIPARVPRYPNRSLEALLQHEVTHVLAFRATGGRDLPRWFDEGVATAASRDRDFEDRARVGVSLLVDGGTTLANIDAAFAGGSGSVAVAYALAGDFVGDLERRHGTGTIAAILAASARGASFEDAFAEVVGEPLARVEAAYWKRQTFWHRWLPLVSSNAVLWGGASILVVLAFRRRRKRDAALRAQWDEEEREQEAARALEVLEELDDSDLPRN